MKAVIHNYDNAADFFRRLISKYGRDFERPMLIEVKPYQARRSLEQNSKLHAMISELAAHIGYSASELKEFLKLEYGPTKLFEYGDHQTMIAKSTAEYTKQEMIAFIDQIYMVAAEAGYKFKEYDNGES